MEGFSWQYIFWLNVPIGILLVPLALTRLTESHGPAGKLDLPGVGLVSAGMFGIVWGLIRGNEQGWASPEILTALGLGVALVAAFVAWELRAPHPMLPMTFFRNTAFSLANLASLFMFFGMFGSIFLLTQFFQTVQGYSPLSSGLRILPWTLAPMFVAPFAGAMSDKVSPKRILSIGLTLQAIALGWIAFVSTPTTPYGSLIVPVRPRGRRHGAVLHADGQPRALVGAGVSRRARRPGANNAIRELGGVFGVAVLASVFSRYGGYGTGQTFVDGMTPALWIGAVVVGLGAVAAFAIPTVRRQRADRGGGAHSARRRRLTDSPAARVTMPSASRPGPLLLL